MNRRNDIYRCRVRYKTDMLDSMLLLLHEMAADEFAGILIYIFIRDSTGTIFAVESLDVAGLYDISFAELST